MPAATSKPEPPTTPPARTPQRITPLLLGSLTAVAVRLPFVFQSPSVQLSLMPDDASYYLEAARRVVEGAPWPTLDGVHATNGFHPLYMLLAIAVQAAFGTDPLRIVPLILALHLALGVAAYVLLLRAAAPWTRAGGTTTAVLLAASAGLWSHSLAGLENGVAAPLVLLLALRWRDTYEASERPTSAFVIDGLLAGLAMLARTDAALFCAVTILAMVLRARAAERMRVLASVGITTATASAVLAPWFALQLVHVGTIAQDSASALLLRHAALSGPLTRPHAWFFHAQQFAFWVHRLLSLWGVMPLTAFLLATRFARTRTAPNGRGPLFVLLVCVAITAVLPGPTLWQAGPARPFVIHLLLAGIAFAAGLRVPTLPLTGSDRDLLVWLGVVASAYALGLGHFQTWYSTTPAIVGVGLLTLPAALTLFETARPRAVSLALVALLAVHSLLITRHYLTAGTCEGMDREQFTRGKAIAAGLRRWQSEHPGARIGSFDCGELSYLVHPFPIVDLDGVMNHDAVVALRAHRLGAWIREQRIEALITVPARLEVYAASDSVRAEPDRAATRTIGMTTMRVLP